MIVSEEEYIDCLYTLEIARDSVNTTDDETEVIKEAHNIIQNYRREGEL